MKKLLLSLPLLAFTFNTMAQSPTYEDLLVLYVDEEYEKCVSKGERYTENKSTRNDPLPYLYLSKCFHEMSKLERYSTDPVFKNADREALKYAVKFRKKDRDNEHYDAHEDHWRDLDRHAMEAGMNWYEQGKYPRARMIFSRMVAHDPSNVGAWKMLALCQSQARMTREAQESMTKALEAYAAAKDQDEQLRTLSEEQLRLLKISLIQHGDHLMRNDMQDSARVVLDLGIDHFADDPEFKLLYEDVN